MEIENVNEQNMVVRQELQNLYRSGAPDLNKIIRSGDYDHAWVIITFRLVDINKLNERGWAPLHEAMDIGSMEFAILLYKNGANPDILTKDGYTPTMLAASKGYLDLVILNVWYNAKIDLKRENKDAIDLAMENGKDKVADFLREAKEAIKSGQDVREFIHQWVKANREDTGDLGKLLRVIAR